MRCFFVVGVGGVGGGDGGPKHQTWLKPSSLLFFIHFTFLISFQVIDDVCDKGRVLVLCCPDVSKQLLGGFCLSGEKPASRTAGGMRTPNLEEGGIFSGGCVKQYRCASLDSPEPVKPGKTWVFASTAGIMLATADHPPGWCLGLRGALEQMWSVLLIF